MAVSLVSQNLTLIQPNLHKEQKRDTRFFRQCGMMRKHCYRQNLILLRMRLSRCAHTSNKWVFPRMNACIVVVDQVFSDIRFCPNFLVSEPNYVL